ncbi:MAG: hypothetical protein ABEK01_05660 [Candidatus Nanohaloarchaea archaeon]
MEPVPKLNVYFESPREGSEYEQKLLLYSEEMPEDLLDQYPEPGTSMSYDRFVNWRYENRARMESLGVDLPERWGLEERLVREDPVVALDMMKSDDRTDVLRSAERSAGNDASDDRLYREVVQALNERNPSEILDGEDFADRLEVAFEEEYRVPVQ